MGLANGTTPPESGEDQRRSNTAFYRLKGEHHQQSPPLRQWHHERYSQPLE
jgi:hypothetical protein